MSLQSESGVFPAVQADSVISLGILFHFYYHKTIRNDQREYCY